MARKSLIPYCLDFDGVDDVVTLATNSTFSNATAFTYECWVNRDTAGNREMPVSTTGRWFQITTADVLQGSVATTGGGHVSASSISNETISTGVWVHLAMTYDDSGDRKIHMYKNGVEVTYSTQTAGTMTYDTSNNALRIGNYSSAGWEMDGKIAQVRVWTKALNVADLLIHSKNARDITCANTAGCTYAANCLVHYPMDVENGTGTILLGITGNNGTFKGAGEPAWSTNPAIPVSRPVLTQARTVPTYPRNPLGGVYIPGAKSIEGATGDIARTTAGWIEDQKYGWRLTVTATAVSAEFDTAVTRTGAKTLKLSTTDTTGRVVINNTITTVNHYANIKPSTAYVFNCWCKTTNAAANSAYIQLNTRIAGTYIASNWVTNKLTGTNDWTLLTKSFTSGVGEILFEVCPLLLVAGNISDCWYDVNSLKLIETGATTRNPVV